MTHPGSVSLVQISDCHLLALPSYWLPGNHDCHQSMKDALTGDQISPQKTLEIGGWQILLLDSTFPSSQWGEGCLSPAELSRLEHHLSLPPRPTILGLHHHVLPTGIGWLDPMQLLNTDPFFALLAHYPHVRLILSGHIHMETRARHQQIDCYTPPSTCLQVIPDLLNPSPEIFWPGYRVITLYPDGEFQTCVRRVPPS
jgi:Icc protein